MKKYFATLLITIVYALPIIASPDRIPDESGPSTFSMIVGIILAIGFVVLFGPLVWGDIVKGKADKDTKQFGCMILLLIVSIIIAIMVQCG